MAKSNIKSFYEGFNFVRTGYKLVKGNPKLKKLAIIPLIIDLVLFLTCLIWGGGLISQWVATAIAFVVSPESTFLFGVLYYPLLIIFWIAFVVVAVYIIYFVGSIIAAPFNSMLAEGALEKLNTIQPQPFSFGRWISMTLKMTMVSIFKAILFGGVGLIIFILSFLPVLNFAVAFVAFLIIAFDMMDYSFELKELNLRQRLKFFRKNISSFSGMAAMVALTMVIPGLTLLILPFAVVGTAEVFSRQLNQLEV